MQVCERRLQRHLMGCVLEQEDESVASVGLRVREGAILARYIIGVFGEAIFVGIWSVNLCFVLITIIFLKSSAWFLDFLLWIPSTFIMSHMFARCFILFPSLFQHRAICFPPMFDTCSVSSLTGTYKNNTSSVVLMLQSYEFLPPVIAKRRPSFYLPELMAR